MVYVNVKNCIYIITKYLFIINNIIQYEVEWNNELKSNENENGNECGLIIIIIVVEKYCVVFIDIKNKNIRILEYLEIFNGGGSKGHIKNYIKNNSYFIIMYVYKIDMI